MLSGFNPGDRNPQFIKWHPKWQRQRHCIEGEDRIKQTDVDDKYLPRLDGQEGDKYEFRMNPDHAITSYEAYKHRATFLNATGRTVDGLVGAITRKKPDLNWPEADLEQLETVGYCLESFDEIIDEALNEVIGVGRFGHLVDLPPEGDEVNPEPYIVSYHAESITNWMSEMVGSRKKTTCVTLSERSGVSHMYEDREVERFRVLRLGVPVPETDAEQKMSDEEFLALFGLQVSDFDDGPIYFQEVWVEVEGSEDDGVSSRDYHRAEIIVPRAAGGMLLDEIPFTFFNPMGTKPKCEKPPLLDLCVLNLSHYRNTADHEHGLHFTALPQPFAAGFQFDGNIHIGSGVAWVSENAQANCGYMEFTGQGLGAIERTMERKQKQMAMLGGRLLEEQATGSHAETAETVKLRHSGEQSVLARMSLSVAEGLSRSLVFLRRFRSQSEDVSVKLNLDFGVEGLDPKMLTALMQQVHSGLMSWDTYVYNMRRGELYQEGWSNDDEAAAIQAGPPTSANAVLDPRRDEQPDDEADDEEQPLDEEDDAEAVDGD
tara:strand:+ start:5254 stop:6885 length:1632 start_codon:yes stop_codon:yes gene_type:complete